MYTSHRSNPIGSAGHARYLPLNKNSKALRRGPHNENRLHASEGSSISILEGTTAGSQRLWPKAGCRRGIDTLTPCHAACMHAAALPAGHPILTWWRQKQSGVSTVPGLGSLHLLYRPLYLGLQLVSAAASLCRDFVPEDAVATGLVPC